ncbi:MAG TPA: alpha/beta fold hydrolase [Kofleriaceae bacterium]|nr:alpha/beta fold hydrolase [Kofleriaceae bacterium]
MPILADVGGHAWTVWPRVRDRFRPPVAPPSAPWSTEIDDPTLGIVKLSGRIDHVAGARGLVIIVHGMGGSAERTYCAVAASAARAAGLSSLRLNLRGADGSGEDLYHIGLVDDVEAAVAHPEVTGYERLYAIGFSLGGHIALRAAALGGAGGRLRAVASVCAPIDLDACCAHIDHAKRWAYRMHLLAGVKEVYRTVAARRPMPEPVEAVLAIRSVRVWDERVVAPRFGFAGASDYYRRVGVGPLLPGMAIPALVVASESDPMVPARTVRPALVDASSAVEVRWLRRGGHVGFPGEVGILSEIVGWLAKT